MNTETLNCFTCLFGILLVKNSTIMTGTFLYLAPPTHLNKLKFQILSHGMRFADSKNISDDVM